MNGILVRAVLRRSISQVRYVSPVRPCSANGLVDVVYRQVEDELGVLAPPVALHSPAPWALAACWTMLRETLVASGEIDRDTQEAVATVVSLANTCMYCADVHTMTLEALSRRRTEDPEADQRIGRISAWAWASATAVTARQHRMVFPARHAAELIGTVAAFHYLNRMVNVFLPSYGGGPGGLRGFVLRLLGRTMQTASRRPHVPGASLDLLPAAPLPPDLSWSTANEYLAEAFARATNVIETNAARTVSGDVRALVSGFLADWSGEEVGTSAAWADDAVTGLPAADRAVGKLALLTALTPTHVDQVVVDDFHRAHPGDAALVEAAAWASLAAARRVASWIPAGTPA
jgi:AhpD family alkylhydroperoxidase